MALTISDSDYNRILTAIGYPVVSPEMVGLTDDNIKELFVLPVLTDVYSIYFPTKTYSQYTVGTSFSVDFPNDTTFGIVDARLNTRPYAGTSVITANPLINDMNIRSSQYGRKMWGTNNDYGYTAFGYTRSLEATARVLKIKALNITVNVPDRVLEGYTNVYGNLSVTWADYSEDWNDIELRFKEDAIKLAKARLLEFLGMLREQAVGDLPSELSGSDFLTQASNFTDEVMGKWNSFPKIAIIRG